MFSPDTIAAYDHALQCWTKRKHAAKALEEMAHAGIPPRSMKIDKDGPHFRLYFSAIGAMWSPIDAASWDAEFARIKKGYES